MAGDGFDEKLQRLKSRIDPLEKVIHLLAAGLLQPILYDSGSEHYGFRYLKPTVVHFCLLKIIRAVSALNAALELARCGYSQEVCVLLRTLVECTTHIEYVLSARDDTGRLKADAEKYVEAYFTDFARNTAADFKRAQIRQQKVHEHLGAILDNLVDRNSRTDEYPKAEKLYSNIYLTLSNYVHAKYPEVMDLYGGAPGHFHLRGMRGTTKDNENFEQVENLIGTVAITLKLMIVQLQLRHLIDKDLLLTGWFEGV